MHSPSPWNNKTMPPRRVSHKRIGKIVYNHSQVIHWNQKGREKKMIEKKKEKKKKNGKREREERKMKKRRWRKLIPSDGWWLAHLHSLLGFLLATIWEWVDVFSGNVSSQLKNVSSRWRKRQEDHPEKEKRFSSFSLSPPASSCSFYCCCYTFLFSVCSLCSHCSLCSLWAIGGHFMKVMGSRGGFNLPMTASQDEWDSDVKINCAVFNLHGWMTARIQFSLQLAVPIEILLSESDLAISVRPLLPSRLVSTMDE